MTKKLAMAGALAVALAGCATTQTTTSAHADGTAMASYYGGGPKKYEPNSHTANGERFRPDGHTLAHRSLPFGTRVRVTYGGRSVVCRVNDRGPAKWTGRSLDLSRGCARAIGMIPVGVARVRYAVLR